MNKFHARKETVDGIVFASKAEARRFRELKILQRAGEISHLEVQPEFKCTINGKLVCTYRADFRYRTKSGSVTEDVKGMRTPVYRLKKKLVEALFAGSKIVEITRT